MVASGEAGMGGLVPDRRNANRGTVRGRALLEDSLRRYGAGRSILADKHGNVIAGNKTLEASADIGLPVRFVESDGTDLIVVRRTDLDLDTDTAARELAYADNRIAALDLDWDIEQLLADRDAGIDLAAVGFDADELAALLAGIGDDPTEGLTDPDAVPPVPADPITKPGDLWTLGRHRLLCGDSTSATDTDRLLAGARLALAFTSFPYGVGLDYGDTYTDDIENLRVLLRDVPPLVFAHLAEGGYFVTNTCDVVPARHHLQTDEPCEYPIALDYWPALRAPGFFLHTRRIWAKPHARVSAPWTANSNRAACDWEHIWTWKKPGRGLNERRDPSYFGVWDSMHLEGVDIGKQIHPAAFPVGIAAAVYGVYSNRGDMVYDPFCGTGTTIIAAEKDARTCYGMEISPAYTDVCVSRWEAYTGLRAVRDGA